MTGVQTCALPICYYQDLHANAVTRIKAFLEPALIVSLTVVVGFIVLAVVIPMFSMYDLIQTGV